MFCSSGGIDNIEQTLILGQSHCYFLCVSPTFPPIFLPYFITSPSSNPSSFYYLHLLLFLSLLTSYLLDFSLVPISTKLDGLELLKALKHKKIIIQIINVKKDKQNIRNLK